MLQKLTEDNLSKLFIAKSFLVIGENTRDEIGAAIRDFELQRSQIYFSFHESGDIESLHWKNDFGLYHREGDLPAQIGWSEKGTLLLSMFFKDGLLHREINQPAVLLYYHDGCLWETSDYKEGVLHRDPYHGPAHTILHHKCENYTAPHTEAYYWEGGRVTRDYRPNMQDGGLGRKFI